MVIGASGGCGIAGLQLAQYMNASEVIAVSSDKNRELVLQEGATGYLNYATTNIADRCKARTDPMEKFDIVYDCVTGSGSGDSYKSSALACLRHANITAGRKHCQYVAAGGGTGIWMRMFGPKQNEHLFLNKPNTTDLNLIA